MIEVIDTNNPRDQRIISRRLYFFMFRSVKIQSQKCLDLHYRTFLIYASVTKDVVAQGHFAFVISYL